MKKVGKTLLIAGTVVAMSIGTAGIMNINNMQKEENKVTIQAYNHTPANILDNVFERNNVKYLPFIYDSPMLDDEITPRTISKTEVVNAFASRNLEVEFSTGDIRTGTRISVKGSSDVYTVVIYGDVDGDGCVDTFDAQAVVDYYINGEIGLNEVCKIAANVDNDTDEIDTFDAQKIIDFYLGTTTKLVLNEPNHVVENDTTPPVIKFGGQAVTGTQTKTLKVGDTFNEPTVTATDDVDGDVTAKIVRTGDTVDTNAVGTYTITYTVSDTKGNTTTVIYVVNVENKDVPPTPQVTFDGIRVDGISSLELPILETTYTNVPVTFLKDGQAVDGEITASILRDKNFSIEVPKIKIPGQSTSTNDDAILVEYNQTGKIEQIRFKVANDAIKMMDSDKIKFKIGSQTIAELEVKIDYNIPDKIVLDTSVANIGTFKEGEGANAQYIYAARVNTKKPFVLGAIKTQKRGDKPILEEDMVISQIPGIRIFANSYDGEGNLLITARITDTAVKRYTISLDAEIEGVQISTEENEEIKVQSFNIPADMNITFKKYTNNPNEDIDVDNKDNPISLIKGSADYTENSAVTKIIIDPPQTSDKKDVAITANYMTIKQFITIDGVQKEGNYLNISKCKIGENGRPGAIKEADEIATVADSISLGIKDDTPITDITVVITYYDGLGGELETSNSFIVTMSEKQ